MISLICFKIYYPLLPILFCFLPSVLKCFSNCFSFLIFWSFKGISHESLIKVLLTHYSEQILLLQLLINCISARSTSYIKKSSKNLVHIKIYYVIIFKIFCLWNSSNCDWFIFPLLLMALSADFSSKHCEVLTQVLFDTPCPSTPVAIQFCTGD